MKKIVTLITFLFIFSCSSDSTDASFKIDTLVNSTTVNVDEEISITITSPEEMTGIEYSYDNFKSSFAVYPGSGYGTSKTLNFKFFKIGISTLYFRAYKSGNAKSQVKTVALNVEKGNRVKITGLKINSFDGINNSWDPEFITSDPNRLADVRFSFLKLNFLNALDDEKQIKSWYETSVKENQGDLTWSLINEELYTDSNSIIYFSIYDMDGPSLVQDLDKNFYDKFFKLSSYATTKPSSVTFSYPEDNVEFILQLEWPK